MNHQPKTFTIIDPREMDGDPFEVAQRACLQVSALAHILAKQIEVTEIAARNAEMERQIIDTGDPDAAAWDESIQAKQLRKLQELSSGIEKRLTKLAQAAGFNPKARIPKDE